MNARSHIGVQAGIAADFGLWTLISWAAGWHGWMIAIPAAALLITAPPRHSGTTRPQPPRTGHHSRSPPIVTHNPDIPGQNPGLELQPPPPGMGDSRGPFCPEPSG